MQYSSKLAVVACGILVLQTFVTFAWSKQEYLPSPPPLSSLPADIGPWHVTNEHTLDTEAYEMLSPDDVLNRVYTKSDENQISLDLFVAYYKSQHRAKGAHDPKVCLPGSGWNPIKTDTIVITIPHSQSSISANYYLIEKGNSRNLVIYWFQTASGTLAHEQTLRLANLFDSARRNRSDMALVRIVIPVERSDEQTMAATAEQFAQSLYPALTRYFPA